MCKRSIHVGQYVAGTTWLGIAIAIVTTQSSERKRTKGLHHMLCRGHGRHDALLMLGDGDSLSPRRRRHKHASKRVSEHTETTDASDAQQRNQERLPRAQTEGQHQRITALAT